MRVTLDMTVENEDRSPITEEQLADAFRIALATLADPAKQADILQRVIERFREPQTPEGRRQCARKRFSR